MSIYVACQCGQAFSAPIELAGQTLPCPSCQQPLTVPLQGTAPPANVPAPVQQPAPVAAAPVVADPIAPSADPFATSPASPLGGMPLGNMPLGNMPLGNMPLGQANDPFAGSMNMPAGMATTQAAKPQMLPDDESPLIFWLATIGGGMALVLVIGLFIYNATRKPRQPIAGSGLPVAAPVTSTPITPPSTTPSTTVPPVVAAPMETTPVPLPMPTVPEASSLPEPFVPPTTGQMVTSGSGEFEVWMPSEPAEIPIPAIEQLPGSKASMKLNLNPETLASFGLLELVLPIPATMEMMEFVEKQFGRPLAGTDAEFQTTKTKFQSYDAIEQRGKSKVSEGGTIRCLYIAADQSICLLFWSGAEEAIESDEVKTFFASFRKRAMNVPDANDPDTNVPDASIPQTVPPATGP